jgi:hypothetical protein
MWKRSLFLLSLAAAPLANAATPPTPASASTQVVAAMPSDTPVETTIPVSGEAALLRARVQELETALGGVRRELARIREEEDARARVIGDPNVHSMWP